MLWNNDYYSRLEEALGEHYSIKAARSHQAAIDYVEKVQLHPVHMQMHARSTTVSHAHHAPSAPSHMHMHAWELPSRTTCMELHPQRALSINAHLQSRLQVVKEEGIECGFERVDGFLFPKADSDVQTLEKELAAAVRAGLTDVKMVRAPCHGPSC
jgi:hypothetical protein